MTSRGTLTTLSLFTLLLAACTAGVGTTPTTSPAGVSTARPTGELGGSGPVSEDPWRTAELRDVRTGDTFRVADLAGRLVVIEPMAIWCANCAHQQREAAKALAALDRDDIVYISLDIDPQEVEADLASYADERGFDWRFVVASRDVARAFAEAFGDQVLSPPSTPSVIVTPGGEVLGPTFGIRDAEALTAELLRHLS